MADPDYPGCSGCGKKDQLDKMLLCDSYKDRGCKAEWHMHCLTPPLKAVPQDDWFCPRYHTTPHPHSTATDIHEQGQHAGLTTHSAQPPSLPAHALPLTPLFLLCSCAAVKAEDDEATRREEARLKPHDYILLPPPTPDTPAQLACITQVRHTHTHPQVSTLILRPPRAKHVTQTHYWSPSTVQSTLLIASRFPFVPVLCMSYVVVLGV